MTRRAAGLATAAALQLVAVVLAHELIFLARYGSIYNEALVHAGHGAAWSSAVTTSLALAGILAGLAVLQLVRLGVLVRSRAPVAGPAAADLPPGPLLRSWLWTGLRMGLGSVVLLTLQENVERAAMGQAAPGIGILLAPEYAGGLWVTLAVALAVALIVALFTWQRRALLARLRAGRARDPRHSAPAIARPGILVRLPAPSLLGRRSALRAPPTVAPV